MINVIACFDQNSPSEEFVTSLESYNGDGDFQVVELDPFGSEFAHLQIPKYLDGLFRDVFINGMQIQNNYSRKQGKCTEVGSRIIQLDGRNVARSFLTYSLISKCEGIIESIRETHENYKSDNFVIVIYNLGKVGRYLLSHIQALGLEKDVTFNFYGFPKSFNAGDLRTFDNNAYIETKIQRAKSRTPHFKATESLPIHDDDNEINDDVEETIDKKAPNKPKKAPVKKTAASKKDVKEKDEEPITAAAKKRTAPVKKAAVKTEDETSTPVKKPRKARVTKNVEIAEEDDAPASEESLQALTERFAK